MSASGGVMRVPRGGRSAAWTILEVVLVLLVALAAVVVLANLGEERTQTNQGARDEIVVADLTWAERIDAMREVSPRRRAP